MNCVFNRIFENYDKDINITTNFWIINLLKSEVKERILRMNIDLYIKVLYLI